MDGNNQHAAFLSTDLPEENWPWPTSSWEWRDKFAKRLKDYTLGLFWFAQHDPALPEHFRKDIAKWGLAKDEYQDNENFPRQVYVREGRRFEGVYFSPPKTLYRLNKENVLLCIPIVLLQVIMHLTHMPPENEKQVECTWMALSVTPQPYTLYHWA